jgi:hypothetical protein
MYQKHYKVLKLLEELLPLYAFEGKNFCKTLYDNVGITFHNDDMGISLYTVLNITTLYHISTRESKVAPICYGSEHQASSIRLSECKHMDYIGGKDSVSINLFPVNIETGEGEGEIFQLSTIYDNTAIDEIAIMSHYKYNNPNGISVLSYSNHTFCVDTIIEELTKLRDTFHD